MVMDVKRLRYYAHKALGRWVRALMGFLQYDERRARSTAYQDAAASLNIPRHRCRISQLQPEELMIFIGFCRGRTEQLTGEQETWEIQNTHS